MEDMLEDLWTSLIKELWLDFIGLKTDTIRNGFMGTQRL